MERTKRMLFVMLTSFAIFALLTFLTFSSYGQIPLDTDYTVQTKDTTLSPNSVFVIILDTIVINPKKFQMIIPS